MTRLGVWTAAWACLASVTVAAPINVKDPPHGLFADDWAEVYMAGGKIGYAHSTMIRKQDRIHTATVMKMKVGRADHPVEIETAQGTTETLAGAPLAFTSDMTAAVMKTSMRGTIAGGRVTIVTSQYGMEQTQAFPYASGALMTWGLFRESLLRGFTPGSQYTLSLYAPELRLDGPVSAVTKIGPWERFQHRDKTMRGQKVTLSLQAPMGVIDTVSWVDAAGRPLKLQVPMPGLGDIVVITTDEKTALADFVPPEIFLTSVIRANRRIDPKAADRITYRIRSTAPDVDLGELPSTGMQQVVGGADGAVKLVVSRQSHRPRHPRLSGRATPTGSDRRRGPERAEYLGSNMMINTSDPKLVALAQRAAGGETEPFKLADRLRRFVTQYVKTKNLNIGFATASEVCRTKEGDCTEHGVLLAALGRINGLPSRVVVGVAYVPSLGDRTDVFGYHLWTEFFIDGRWIDLDAALPETVCSPTRIAFATSSLKNTSLADLSLPLLNKIGAIDIDVVQVEGTRAP